MQRRDFFGVLALPLLRADKLPVPVAVQPALNPVLPSTVGGYQQVTVTISGNLDVAAAARAIVKAQCQVNGEWGIR